MTSNGPNAHWGFKKDETKPAMQCLNVPHEPHRLPSGQGCAGVPEQLDTALFDKLRAAENAYAKGGSAAAADAQACKTGANGTNSWRSRPHLVPADPDERAAWMRGYGKVFAWWGGARDDVQVTDH